MRVVHGYGDGTRGLCQTMRSKKRDKTMPGLVPLGVDIRLMPQTINMAKVHGFSLSCLAGGALRIRQGCGGGAQTGSDGGKGARSATLPIRY